MRDVVTIAIIIIYIYIHIYHLDEAAWVGCWLVSGSRPMA